MGLIKIIAYLIAIFFIANSVLFGMYYFSGGDGKISELLQVVGYNPGIPKNVNASSSLAMFESNMRFNHNTLTFFINSACEKNKITRMYQAFSIVTEQTEIILFKPAKDEASADILIGCTQDAYQFEKNVFASGEGGPTEYYSLDFYPLILKGKILLYNEDSCDYPITELHELFHVLGFDHINNPNLIMYPYVGCKETVNPELIAKLKELYSIEPLAELYFSNISASKTGSYLNFRVQINNDGLIAAENFYLKLYVDNAEIDSFDFKLVPVGTSNMFYITNEKLPSSAVNRIKLVIEYSGKEYNKANNVVELSV